MSIQFNFCVKLELKFKFKLECLKSFSYIRLHDCLWIICHPMIQWSRMILRLRLRLNDLDEKNNWFRQESNLDSRIQSPLWCRYTTESSQKLSKNDLVCTVPQLLCCFVAQWPILFLVHGQFNLNQVCNLIVNVCSLSKIIERKWKKLKKQNRIE